MCIERPNFFTAAAYDLKMRTILLGSALILCVSGAESDWPQFRGPEANPVGSNARLADRWSKTENVEWAADIPGRGWSSPVVSGDKVFLTTAVTEGKSKQPQTGTEYSNEYAAELMKQGLTQAQVLEKVTARDIELPGEVKLHYFLYCIHLKSGRVEWKKEFYTGQPPGGRHRKNSFSSESPVTDGKHVFVYAGNLGLYAFDFQGKQVWNTALEANPIYLEFGTGGSPALYQNQLIILSDNEKQQYIASFDKRTGKPIWRTNRNIRETGGGRSQGSAWTTPFVWTNKQRTEIVTIGPAAAVSYDLEGKELWRLGGMSATPVPSPFSYDGLLYINAGRGKPLFAVLPGAKGDITLAKTERANEYVAWSDARGGTYLPTPVAYDGGVYSLTETGILSRYEAKTGKLSYKTRLDAEAGYFTTSPWAYNGKVFFLSEEGKTFVVEAGDGFRLLQVNSLDEMAQATPAIVNDRLLVRTESRLYSIRKGR
jgi:outer membrane protein assembly factor BamB